MSAFSAASIRLVYRLVCRFCSCSVSFSEQIGRHHGLRANGSASPLVIIITPLLTTPRASFELIGISANRIGNSHRQNSFSKYRKNQLCQITSDRLESAKSDRTTDRDAQPDCGLLYRECRWRTLRFNRRDSKSLRKSGRSFASAHSSFSGRSGHKGCLPFELRQSAEVYSHTVSLRTMSIPYTNAAAA
jgi:hypothetical protein